MIKSVIALLLALASILVPSFAAAAFQNPEIRLDTGEALGGSDSSYIQICDTDDGNIYAIWDDYRNNPSGEIFFNRSTDYGRTWQPIPTIIQPTPYGGRDMTCSSDGNIYIAWTEDPWGGEFGLYTRHSGDGGITWNAPELIESVTYDPYYMVASAWDLEILSVDNGHALVLWSYQILDNMTGDFFSYGPRVFYTSNFGLSWTISTGGGEFYYGIRMRMTPSGRAYLAFAGLDYWSMWEGLMLLVSSDFGQTWSMGFMAPFLYGYINNPAVCSTENGFVYLAWVDTRNGQEDVFFNYSSDNGATWQPTDARLDVGDPAGVSVSIVYDIECSENGNVLVAYRDSRNSPINYDTYMNSSSDFGSSWLPADVRLDIGYAPGEHDTYGRFTADQVGNMYFTFKDDRNGGSDLFVIKSGDYGANWSATLERINVGSPVGLGATMGYDIGCENNGNFYAAWIDGRTNPSANDVYFNYWTEPQALTPTLSEYMIVFLGVLLLFSLIFIVRTKIARI